MESVALTLTKQRESEARKAKAKAKAAIGTTRTKGVFKGKVVAREEVPRRKRATLVSLDTVALVLLLPSAFPCNSLLVLHEEPWQFASFFFPAARLRSLFQIGSRCNCHILPVMIVLLLVLVLV